MLYSAALDAAMYPGDTPYQNAHTRTFRWVTRTLESGHPFISMMPTRLRVDAKIKSFASTAADQNG
ncbi:hypothetical protein QP178_19345 [Sphingomonas aurantiaca]|uniref:hypothetical protein n=1 Tax=Sphingomonas aurantiaca TaxID=185949 RepID=UPI002FE1C9E7